jgi:hypothetical protein
MADQGAIGKHVVEWDQILFPAWTTSDILNVRRQDGSYSGVVTLDTVPVKNVAVTLQWRPTGQVIARKWTDENGAYTFTGLDPTTPESYRVICDDPTGGTLHNDQVLAQSTPDT